MTSEGAIKFLARLNKPRTIESLISEIYGEATWFGCLFEQEVADLLNYAELSHNLVGAMMRKPFNTEDWTLSGLIAELAKRDLPEEHLEMLKDGKAARNTLVHRLIATRCVISRADKELFLAEIDALYFRVWRAYRSVNAIKKAYAAKIGVTDERVNEMVRNMREEAEMEENNLTHLLGKGSDEPYGS